jgi:hypothetical protein
MRKLLTILNAMIADQHELTEDQSTRARLIFQESCFSVTGSPIKDSIKLKVKTMMILGTSIRLPYGSKVFLTINGTRRSVMYSA